MKLIDILHGQVKPLHIRLEQLKILELRQKAKKRELGDKYDIKDFHHERF